MSQDLRKAVLKVYTAIFENRDSVEGVSYFIERTPKSKPRAFEIDGLIFIEQNPNKDPSWVQLARESDQTIWVVMRCQYVGRVVDDKLLDFGED